VKDRTPRDQVTLEGKVIEGVLDMTAGLHGMQYEVGILASDNLDASPFRKVDVRGDFTHLPYRDEAFEKVLFDPPHTVDSRNTLLGTIGAAGGLGPHMGAFKYGCYRSLADLRKGVFDGAAEAARVLKPGGVLIFKWSNSEKPYSWATDTVEKAAKGLLEKFRIHTIRSGAHTANFSFYAWYRKRVQN